MAEVKSSWSASDEEDLLSVAREFARTLAGSEQFKELERSRRVLMTNQPGFRALKEFGDFQERLGWLVQQGLACVEEKVQLARLEKAMHSHEVVESFLDAETEFARLCQEAAALVSSLIGVNLTEGADWVLNVDGCLLGVSRMLDADTEKASRELAKRILESRRMTALTKAKEILAQDGAAQRVLRNLDEAQDELLEGYDEGREASKEQIETIKRLYRELKANPGFAAVARAQQGVQDLLSGVIEEVSELLGVKFGAFARSQTCC